MPTYGKAIVFGAVPAKPIINIPPDAQKVRMRLRSHSLGMAFVKYADRIEQWGLMPADEKTASCPEWKLGFLKGVNKLCQSS